MINNSEDKGFLQDVYQIHNPVQLKILNYLLFMKSKFDKVCPSQITMARKFGVSRETINRHVQTLKERGLIATIRKHNQACEYFVSSLFKKYKNFLGHIYFAVHKFNIRTLISQFLGGVTLSKKSVLNHGYSTEVFNGVIKNITHPQARENSSELKKRQENGRDSNHPGFTQGNRSIETHQVGTVKAPRFP